MYRLPILFRDEHYVAVDKPSGLLVHRSAIDRHETRFALQLVRNQLGRHVYPLHRLDKPTSGVLVFALHPEAARRLGAAFTSRAVAKGYVAVVRGWPDPEGVIDHPLKEALDAYGDERADPDKPAQPAVTEYRRLATVEIPEPVDRYPTSRYALVAAYPRTGRKHQIRRHLKHLGHPLIGDSSYGKGRHNRFFATRFGVTRLLLAATELGFVHPYTGEPCRIVAPLRGEFACLIEELGWREAVPAEWLRVDGTDRHR